MQNEADGAPNTAAWNALNAIRTPGSVDDTSGRYVYTSYFPGCCVEGTLA